MIAQRCGAFPKFDSVIDYLEHWASVHPDKTVSTFNDVTGRVTEAHTYRSFERRTRLLASHLRRLNVIAPGDRILLAFPPGLEIAAALIACARVGAIAVPCLPPAVRSSFWAQRTRIIAHDSDARLGLTTQNVAQALSAASVDGVEWLATDILNDEVYDELPTTSGGPLFLQYTSGSTSEPRGVLVPNRTVISNALAVLSQDHDDLRQPPVGVSWLPQYHDMGLIGFFLFPIVAGGATHAFSPSEFLRRPALWFQLLTRERATCTSAPNFGLEYCLREDRLPEHDLANVDLSSVRFFLNAAELVRPDTQRRFLKRFRAYGLRESALVAAYGLAENTLAATKGGQRVIWHVVDDRPVELQSCGRPVGGVVIEIINPSSANRLRDGEIGEICLSGNAVCDGYWNTATAAPSSFGPLLRTGDLGLINDGELFVCGRLKDMIIVRGRNVFPQDIEDTLLRCFPQIGNGRCVAFRGRCGETAAVLIEVRAESHGLSTDAISTAIGLHVGVAPEVIIFARRGTIVRTTSGKVARNATRLRWLRGDSRLISVHGDGLANTSSPLLTVRALLDACDHAADDASVAELGIDSLRWVELASELSRGMTEVSRSCGQAVLDSYVLQRLTIGELRKAMKTLDGDPCDAQCTASFLKQIGARQDASDLDFMRSDLTTTTVKPPQTARECRAEPTRVLMTGATGFLGPYLLASLLRRTSAHYYLLVRADSEPNAFARVHAELCRRGLITTEIKDALSTRVTTLCGDMTKPQLGLSKRQWIRLTETVADVIHNAAAVNYVWPYSRLRETNVEGTRRVLDLATTGLLKPCHYISSTIVFGWSRQDVAAEDDCNAEMEQLDFGYAQTKWVAEQMFVQARLAGLPVQIFRPAFLSATADGFASADDIVIRLLAFMIQHSIAILSDNQLSCLPVDVAAENIAAICTEVPDDNRTFHVTSNTYYNMTQITESITQQFGYEFEYLTTPAFVAAMRRLCRPSDAVYPLLDFFERSHNRLDAMRRKRYDNRHFRKALRQCKTFAAEPSVADIALYLVRAVERVGYMGVGGLRRASDATGRAH